MKSIFSFSLLMLGLLGVALPASAATNVPASLVEGLQRGVNIENWLQTPRNTGEISATELQELKSLGFGHVRLPVTPGLVDSGGAEFVARIDHAVDAVNKAGLVAIVDYHASEEMSKRLTSDTAAGVASVCQTWQTIGQSLAGTDPKQVAIELYNEPRVSTDLWTKVAPQIVGCVRKTLPNHTLLIGGTGMNQWGTLKNLPVIKDSNIVYIFHYYEPMMFTHQGATWLKNSIFAATHDVPFPPRMTEEVSGNLGQLQQKGLTDYAGKLGAYLNSSNAVERIAQDFQAIAEWRKARGNPPVVMTEFGAMTKAPGADRALWIQTVRTAAERHGFGWTMWDYNSSFGLYSFTDGRRWLNLSVAKALGLQAPQ